MKTVFLSMPMKGKTESELMAEQKFWQDALEESFGFEIMVIDNIHHEGKPEKAGITWDLGRSISQMSEADFIVFLPGWMEANGCQIEHMVAKRYNMSRIYFNK